MATQRISRSYALGLTFIVVVTIIWTASSITVQYLYKDLSFHSPFLLTYIGVSLFTLWLPVKMATESCQECIKNKENRGRSDTIRQHDMGGCADYYWSLCCHHLCVWRKPTIYESIPMSTPTTAAATATAVPQERTDRHSVLEEEKEEPVVFDFSSADSEVEEGLDGDDLQDNFAGGMTYHWTHADHFRTACFIAPVWFLANWTYNASLAYTSITSSTVLASTGSLFTFLFAISTNDERFTWAKLAGVLLGFFGSLCTTLHDSSSTIPDIINPENHTLDAGYILLEQQSENSSSVSDALFGDTLGLVSAIGYGAYAVQTRILCPRDESLYSMQLLLGYIGLINMIILSPIAVRVIWRMRHHPDEEQLTLFILSCLVIKGTLDNVISDYLWLRSVILTSATIATVGLGLTIPLAFLSDIILSANGKTQTGSENVLSATSILGAISVLAGFVMVNCGGQEQDDDGDENRHRISNDEGDGAYVDDDVEFRENGRNHDTDNNDSIAAISPNE